MTKNPRKSPFNFEQLSESMFHFTVTELFAIINGSVRNGSSEGSTTIKLQNVNLI